MLSAQVSEEMAIEKLEASGLTEETLREKLLERGIDMDNMEPNNPQ